MFTLKVRDRKQWICSPIEEGFKRCSTRIHWPSKELRARNSRSLFETRRAGGTGCCLRSTGSCRAHKGVMRPWKALKVLSKIPKSALYLYIDSQRSDVRIGEIRSCYLEFVGGVAVEFRISDRLQPYDKIHNTMSCKNQVKMIWRRGQSLEDQPGWESLWPWIIKTENRIEKHP